MAIYGYIYRLQGDEGATPAAAGDAESALSRYAAQLGLLIEEMIVDSGEDGGRPFCRREGGGRLCAGCRPGDVIITTEARWVLGPVAAATTLLHSLRERGVSLYCADIGGDISCDEKRRLAVTEGCAGLIRKLLAALSDGPVEERDAAPGSPIRPAGGKSGRYLGGPVPFGQKVNDDGFLEEDPEQQAMIMAILAMRAERRSYREISRKLLEQYQVRLSYEGVRRVILDRSPPTRKGKAG
jgi:DNA invertase Pin-like site-specific DNA recombinase